MHASLQREAHRRNRAEAVEPNGAANALGMIATNTAQLR